ncbi:glycosyltransferase family 4 protein [Chondrinema litorale]|uniref:glycosyltransferase family 4 protein n=1 Tax=Chondrinema litorale TaxID=2994555 RepID=UPI0025437552|nr:glycosyltransferase family 4 protein [Chondrinema litorale]UZR95779.1 glycosyltransferase family 4 protein [Chondrinema litorale]
MKILILAPYPRKQAPSQRFRFEQYLEALDKNGIDYDYEPFIDEKTWKILHKPGKFVQKALGIINAFFRRLILILNLKPYSFVFIHREASHIGPPVFEWMIAKVFKKKMIYDFDDAIWLPNYSEHNKAFNKLKYYSKVKSIMGWSHKVSAGNAYLADFAKNFNQDVRVNPTTIDTVNYHNQIKDQDTGKVVIGWTGTLTTIKYLYAILPVIEELEKNYDFTFRVIANENPQFNLKSFSFKKWEKATEIEDLLSFNVGVMPLEEDQWAKGKCGFKALQYMSLGIPALVSPVGVNTDIVEHSKNGYICESTTDWFLYLEKLINEKQMRQTLGVNARKTIEEQFSVNSNTNNFLSLFD